MSVIRLLFFALFFDLLVPLEGAEQHRSVFLMGPTGVGKSALGNELTGSEENGDGFKVGSGLHSTTEHISWRTQIYQYFHEEVILSVSDSPGLSDTKGRTFQFLDDMVEAIRKSKPHGFVIVVSSGKDSSELHLTMRALSECLGVLFEDHRRVALFVNMLPSDFQFRSERPSIQGVEKQAVQRLMMAREEGNHISHLLRLKQVFALKTVIGNTHGSWDGVDVLRNFISEMPETSMDLSRIRNWTEVKTEAKQALSETQKQREVVMRSEAELRKRIRTLEDNIAYYENRLKVGGAFVGLGATSAVVAAHGMMLFIPGVNAVTAATAAVSFGGMLLAGNSGGNVYNSWGLDDALKVAKEELIAFMEENPEQRIPTELTRLQKVMKEVDDLESKINWKVCQD